MKAILTENNEKVTQLIDIIAQMRDGGIKVVPMIRIEIMDDDLADALSKILMVQQMDDTKQAPAEEMGKCEICGEPVAHPRTTICGQDECRRERQRRYQKKSDGQKGKKPGATQPTLLRNQRQLFSRRSTRPALWGRRVAH